MKNLVISGLALALMAVPGAALAKNDSGMRSAPMRSSAGMSRHNWGPKHNGRWSGGYRAPGGWNAYRPAVRGYVLPRYWINPSFYIGNYARYGFAQPSAGYGWSRYYDDAVLTNSSGHIYDSVPNFDWDRYDAYDNAGYDGDDYSEDYGDSWGYRDDRPRDDGRRYKDRDGGLGGALAGGAVGAVTGAVIGGRGDRTAGALIGGGLGALAGAAVDSGDRYGRGPKIKKLSKKERRRLGYDGYDDRRGYDDRDYSRRGNARYDGRWDGTWNGSYDGGPQQTYRGTYEGQYRGSANHWGGGHQGGYPVHQGGYPNRGPHVIHHGGYGGGYGWDSGVTTITINSAPVVTTTTVTSEEVVYASVARKRYVPKRTWKPRPKPRCVCR
jgi:Ni/Co efflux regulator RcnB